MRKLILFFCLLSPLSIIAMSCGGGGGGGNNGDSSISDAAPGSSTCSNFAGRYVGAIMENPGCEFLGENLFLNIIQTGCDISVRAEWCYPHEWCQIAEGPGFVSQNNIQFDTRFVGMTSGENPGAACRPSSINSCQSNPNDDRVTTFGGALSGTDLYGFYLGNDPMVCAPNWPYKGSWQANKR